MPASDNLARVREDLERLKTTMGSVYQPSPMFFAHVLAGLLDATTAIVEELEHSPRRSSTRKAGD